MPPDEPAVIADPAAAAPVAETEPAVVAEPTAAADPAAPPAADPAAAPPADPAAEAADSEKPAETPAEKAAGALLGEAPGEKAPGEPGETAGETPPAAIQYEPFTLPQGIKLDDEKIGEFTQFAGEHGLTQEVAQGLLDCHVAAMQAYADHISETQHEVFAETRKGWIKQFEDDPQIGRNRTETSLNEARTAIGWAFGLGVPGKPLQGEALTRAEAERGRLWDAMHLTGAGDHPELIRVWVRMHQMLAPFITERAAPPPPGGRPAGNGNGGPDARYPGMTQVNGNQR